MADSVPPFPYARYNQDVWSCHNPDALAEYVAPDARVHSMTPGNVAGAGLDYLKARAQSLFNAFPDIKFVIEDVVQQDDRLAARVILEGTHRAEFAGIPATGKRMKVYDFAMYRIVDGKITDVWSLIDMQALRDQTQGGSSSSTHLDDIGRCDATKNARAIQSEASRHLVLSLRPLTLVTVYFASIKLPTFS